MAVVRLKTRYECVGEAGVPTEGEGRAVAQVAGVMLEEGLRAGASDEAGPRSESRNRRLTRSAPSKVGEGREAVESGTDREEWALPRERRDQESERGSRRRESDQWRGRRR